jgi:hypothetical protein
MSNGMQTAVVRADDTYPRFPNIFTQDSDDDAGVQVVQTRRRFVQQQDGWFFDQGAGDGSPLLLSAREGLRASAGQFLQT